MTATAGNYSGVYDGSTHALSACQVTGAYTGSLTCANNPTGPVGPGVGSGAVNPSVGGDTVTNYSITSNSGSWSITMAGSTVTVTCPASVTFNGSAQTPCTAGVTGAGGLSQSLTVSYSNNVNAGLGHGQRQLRGDANHNASSNTGGFSINPAPVTATAGSYSGVYDGSTHALSACQVTGVYKGALTCANSPTGPVGPGVGSGTIAPLVGGDTVTNYNITSNSGSWSITNASSTVTVTCPASVTYNGTAQTPCTASVTGAGGLSQSLTVSYSNNVNAGSATASASFSGDANHNASSNSGGFTINKVLLTVTANNTTMTVGAAIPTFTASYSGFVNGETTAVLGGSPSLTTTATSSSPAGTYPITAALGTLTAANYTFTFVNGTLSVLPAPAASATASTTVAGSAAAGYIMTITVQNTGTSAISNLVLTAATLGSTSGSPLPQTWGTLVAGGTAVFTVNFPGSVGADGAGVPENYSGTFTGGTFGGSFRSLKLP